MMNRSKLAVVSGVGALLMLGSAVQAQSASVDLAGVEIRCQFLGPCFEDQIRTSTATLPAADGYRYEITGTVETTGLIGGIVPNGATLEEVLDTFEPGASRLLKGVMRHESGTLPSPVYLDGFFDEFIGLSFGFDITVQVLADGRAQFSFTNIDIPIGFLAGTLTITNGTATVSVWEPSEPIEAEWRFDGNLDAVECADDALLYPMDDPAFGPVLDGTDDDTNGDAANPINNANPNTPTGVTAAQSAFIPVMINGEPATAYQTSPSRLLGTRPAGVSVEDGSRGVGLALAPLTKPEYDAGIIGQWTLIWDMQIPQGSFDAVDNGRPLVALIQDGHNNSDEADGFILKDGASARIGYRDDRPEYLDAPQIAPGQWVRIAISNNLNETRRSRVFINGQFIGETGSDWLYNTLDPRDGERTYSDGTPIDDADWAAWGGRPNPWARVPGPLADSAPFYIASQMVLFADLLGEGESVNLANLFFTDRAMTDGELIALGGANANGIVVTSCDSPCPGDFDGSGSIDLPDLNAVLGSFGSSVAPGTSGDFDGSGFVDLQDLNAVLSAFGSSC